MGALTSYPEPGTGGGTSIDAVTASASLSTWTLAVNDTVGWAAEESTVNPNAMRVRHVNSATGRNCYRPIWTFDTSSVSGTDTIHSGTLSIYGFTNVTDFTSASWKMYAGTSASNDSVTAGDYYSNLTSTTAIADDSYTTSTWSTSAYNDFTLNADGKNNISTTVTKFVARCVNHDVADSAPVSYGNNTLGVTMSDYAGTDRDPVLVVVYGGAELDVSYPEAGTAGTTSDAAFFEDVHTSWTTTINDTASRTTYQTTMGFDNSYGNGNGATYFTCMRSGMTVDTSSIETGATVDSAAASLYVTSFGYSGNTQIDMHAVSFAPASNNSFVTGDYDSLGTTSWGTNDTTMTDEEYFNITFNATGVAAVDETGITKVGFIGDHDIQPTTPTEGNEYSVSCLSADNTGTDKDPLLVVSYTPPALRYVGGNTAITEAGSSDVYTVSLTGLTGGIGSTALEGDIVVVSLASGCAADITGSMAMTGYTNLQTAYSNGTRDVSTLVGYKIMGATPDTTVSVDGQASTNARPSVCAVQVWRGVDTTTPIDVTTTTATGTATDPNPPSITPITSDAVVIAVGNAGNGSNTPVPTVVSGYSNFVNVKNATTNAFSAYANLCSKAWTSGAEDPGVFDFDTDPHSWTSATIALRPESTGGTNTAFFALL